MTSVSAPSRPTPVRSYGRYDEAQAAVDLLADEGFPVEHVSIVGRDLAVVEDVSGRYGYGQATLSGAGSGALVGAALGFFFGLFALVEPLVSGLVLALYGLVAGAVVGGIVGLIGHALTGGRRDFSSASRLEATTYEITVHPDHAEEAERLLQERSSTA